MTLGRYPGYLGGGLYLKDFVPRDTAPANSVLLPVDLFPTAITIARAERAASFAHETALRVCHIARRAGLRSWLVRAEGVTL